MEESRALDSICATLSDPERWQSVMRHHSTLMAPLKMGLLHAGGLAPPHVYFYTNEKLLPNFYRMVNALSGLPIDQNTQHAIRT